MRNRRRSRLLIAAALWTVLHVVLTCPARAAEPVITPAIDGIFAAFERHPLVGLGDLHDLANELAFYAALVRDPRFATDVGHVVVEFGGSQHQDTLDRYLAGENVPYTQLAQVWRNTVAFSPTLLGIGYQTFFAQVRAVNLVLPPERRIRVVLSEPPIDWSAVQTKEQWQRIHDRRDSHAAGVITREILERGKKALVIYGSGHFFAYPWPSTLPLPSAGTEPLGAIVERSHPGAFYFITPYGGYLSPTCSAAFEAEMKWSNGLLVSPVRGTPVEAALLRPGCARPVRGVDPPLPPDELAHLERRFYEIDMGAAGDALLYLAPAAELMRSPGDPQTWMDHEYHVELVRRIRLRGFSALSFPELVPLVTAPPRQWTW